MYLYIFCFRVLLSILGFIILVGTSYDIFVIQKLHISKDTDGYQPLSEEASPLLVESSNADSATHKTYGGTSLKNVQDPTEIGTPVIGT